MRHKRFSAILLFLLMLLLPATVFAEGTIDLDQAVSLTIDYHYDGVALSGMTVDIYLIAEYDETGEITPTADFQDYADAMEIRGENDDAWIALAATLEQDILQGKLGDVQPTDTVVTDENGTAHFPSGTNRLTPGLYLVMGSRLEQDHYVYSTSPFIVSLPGRDAENNRWDYTVEANGKPGKNTEDTDLRVIKIWEDSCHKDQRPESITVQLICDGEPYGDPVTLPENGRWEHTWENLEANHVWAVTETQVDGYKEADIRQEGNTFIITNTCDKPSSPSEPSLPQTGQLWWPIPVLLAAGLLLVVIGLIRRRGVHDEA